MRGDFLALAGVGLLAAATRVRRGGRSEVALYGRMAIEDLRDALTHTHNLPAPTEYLDSGITADVYHTTDPRVVVRVSGLASDNRIERQQLLVDEDFEDGVVSVLYIGEDLGGDHLVTWKERPDTYVEGFLLRRYPDPDVHQPLMYALLGMGDFMGPSEHHMKVLEEFPETQGLARAIRAGLPTTDINLNHNLGVTDDGRVVAYDL